jgi:hypothetical protein
MLFKRLVVWAFLLFVFVASASTLINLGAVGLSDRTSSTEQNEEQNERLHPPKLLKAKQLPNNFRRTHLSEEVTLLQ